jgi:glycerate-2-kinase
MPDLETIYRKTLERCRPETLAAAAARDAGHLPRTIVSIGKCAGPLLDGIASVVPLREAMAVVPHRYPEPKWRESVVVAHGGHPLIDEKSFHAGEALLRFVHGAEDVLFLISGGGSACVEKALQPWFTSTDLMDVNAALVSSHLPIGRINTIRKHLSAIKGGRLAARVRGRSVTFLYSDVSSNAAADVASGPTLPDPSTNRDAAAILERLAGLDTIVAALRDERLPETVKSLHDAEWRVIADNQTLTSVAASIAGEGGQRVVRWNGQIESGVETAAADLAERARQLRRGQILVAGGEPTVAVRGCGRGGRCMELAVRFALAAKGCADLTALFASSDGVDGNSGAAGVAIDAFPHTIDESAVRSRLAESDSLSAAALIGRPIIIPPTGNNLRDLYLVARP